MKILIGGVIDYNPWYLPKGAKKPAAKAEIYSTHVENQLRVENGLNLRAFYSFYQNESGANVGEGVVLLPGTRTNANYPTISEVYWDDEP